MQKPSPIDKRWEAGQTSLSHLVASLWQSTDKTPSQMLDLSQRLVSTQGNVMIATIDDIMQSSLVVASVIINQYRGLKLASLCNIAESNLESYKDLNGLSVGEILVMENKIRVHYWLAWKAIYTFCSDKQKTEDGQPVHV